MVLAMVPSRDQEVPTAMDPMVVVVTTNDVPIVGMVIILGAFTGMLPPIPESDLRACLAVLGRACVHARLLGYEGQQAGLPIERSRLLADLMDAVHNIPDLMTNWPACSQELLRGMLADFDTKWSSSGIALLQSYDQIAAGHG